MFCTEEESLEALVKTSIRSSSLNNQEDQVKQTRNLRILKSQLFEKFRSNDLHLKEQFETFR